MGLGLFPGCEGSSRNSSPSAPTGLRLDPARRSGCAACSPERSPKYLFPPASCRSSTLARGESLDAYGRRVRIAPRSLEAPGRVAIPGRDLVAGQRQGLDVRRLSPGGKGRAGPHRCQGSIHRDLSAPCRRKTRRRPARRPASQVRSRRVERELLRFAGERRPRGRPALLDVAPQGGAGPLGAGTVGDAVQPVPRRLRLRPRSRRRTRRRREAGDTAEGGLEDGVEAILGRPGSIPGSGGIAEEGQAPRQGAPVRGRGSLAPGQRGPGVRTEEEAPGAADSDRVRGLAARR